LLTAADGDEAVSLFQQRQADISLILTDIMMPGMDGIAMIKEILKIKPDQRFVVMSGLAESGTLNSLDDQQRVVFLQKPFTSDVLLETISEILKRA
jgi:YesN/AraC family two-component response regulator